MFITDKDRYTDVNQRVNNDGDIATHLKKWVCPRGSAKLSGWQLVVSSAYAEMLVAGGCEMVKRLVSRILNSKHRQFPSLDVQLMLGLTIGIQYDTTSFLHQS